ncbi:hypothetical protein ACS0TY_025756 [Phlomoides rotata]
MAVLRENTDEQPDPRNVSGSGGSIRRRSARLMSLEAKKSNDTCSERGEASRRSEKKRKTKAATNDVVDALTDSDDKSAHAKVTETLRTFNKHYLHFVQEEENRCTKKKVDSKRSKKSSSKSKTEDTAQESKRKVARPDLKATSEMKKNNTILYSEKRFGVLPGIDVGQRFFSRAEMAAVGIHHHWQSGIDYIGKFSRKSTKDFENYKFPLAVSIVLSGQYEDDQDNCEEIVYTGQGGNNFLGDKTQVRDQVLERGNLALKNSMQQSVPVRVVRGHKCKDSIVQKVYTYDGLYKVAKYWAEKGVAGFTIYKFQLKRLEGQSPLTTKEVYFTRGRKSQSISKSRGLVSEDISEGLENFPIPVTNLVDPPNLPAAFVYIKDIKFGENLSVPTNIPTGCNCQGTCTNPKSCACAKLNGGDFPYVHKNEGRLVEPKAVVFECGPNCRCGPDCVNRTSQKGLKFRLEVFRTPNKGWGVRSWDNIPSGAPICEYVGLLRRTDDLSPATDNSYVFDIDCLQTMKGLEGRESRLRDVSLPSHLQKDCEEASESVPFCIDAGETGNVARFINHSCEPNLFVQCVLSNHHDFKLARVMLIAADNIPPLKELTYDYNYEVDSVLDRDGNIQQMSCFCEADTCRKRLY